LKKLGHRLTWRTSCFLDGGCGKQGLFAHTNGHGDYVLLDELGSPWTIHRCYEDRFCRSVIAFSHGETVVKSHGLYEKLVIREDRRFDYSRIEPPRSSIRLHGGAIARDAIRVCPADFQGQSVCVVGTVREIVRGHAERLMAKLGTMGVSLTVKSLGASDSQLTIEDLDRRSFTFFANLQSTNLRVGDLVETSLNTVHTAFAPAERFRCSSLRKAPLFLGNI
jgi:hypothetical protein